MQAKWVFGAIVCFGLPLVGQTGGEISGRVADPSGSAIPNSVITLTNTATNVTRQVESTLEGFYTFTSVPPGIYNLRSEHTGFKTATTANVEVQVQQTVRMDFSLQIGQVSESIEVSAAAALLQAENATVGTVVETKSIVELPLNGRQYLNLVTLAPNVSNLAPPAGQAQSRQGGDRANQAISAGGNRIVFDYYTLDGVVNTDPNFNTYIVLPSIDALQEFKVQTGVYPAEFGHNATQVNVLTKSGGNAFHGSLFEFVRNNDFDALPYAFTSKPTPGSFKWNDYGFEVDGPVYIPKLYHGRNKLFFMSNYEWLVRRQTLQSVYSVPTADMFKGDFSQLGTPIYDPTTKVQFPGNIIPATRLNQNSLALLKYYNSSTLPGLTSNYVQDNKSPLNRNGFVVRMDFVESAKSQWTGRYSWGDENESTQTINLSGSKLLTNYEQYMGSNTRILTPNLLNEARFGYSRFYNTIGTLSAFNLDVVGLLNLPNLPSGPPVTWGIPQVTFSGDGFTAFGDSTEGPYENNNNTTQFIDNLSWNKGKHSLKVGFEYDRQNYNQVGNQYPRGQYSYSANATRNAAFGQGTGDAFAEFLLGAVNQSTIAVAIANAKFQRNAEAAFVDDTWKVTPKLTVSMGLRWELTPPYTDQLNNLFIVHVPQIYPAPGAPKSIWPYFVRQGNCSDPYTADPAVPIRWTVTSAVCSNGLLPDQLVKTRYNDFAPRFAIAYSPDSKTVIRTGFGTFYAQDNSNSLYFDLARNLAARVSTLATTGQADVTYANAFPPIGGVTSVPPPYAYSDNPNHHTAYTMQYLFNVQRQFGANWSLEAGYLGSVSHHLAGFMNQNEGIPSPVGTAASHLPFGAFTFIQSVEDMGNGEYNSFAFRVNKRFSGGLSLLAAYTHAISIDNTSNIRNQGYDTLFPQNSYCLRCERGLSSFDTRDRLVVSPLYELPVGKGKPLNINNGVANAILGAWQVGGIFTWQSGLPQNITIGGLDNSLTQSTYDRPNATGAGSSLDNPSPAGWYNRGAFFQAPVGQFGNVGRNTATSPGIFAINAEVHKNFRIHENHQLQFRAEAFNALNHPNWGGPNGNILAGSPFPGAPANAPHQGFGTINTLAAGIPMRQLQLGLKYTF
jgi:hypothetical protein